MQLLIIAVGHKMPSWIKTAFDDYAKRMPADCAIKLAEVKPVERTGGMPAEKAMAMESTRIEAVLPKNYKLIVLDERGRDLTSVALAEQLEQWQLSGHNIALVIGGADGIDPALKNRADGMIRLSSLTLPHGMVRVMLAEQLYRAWSINRNHPYHRV